MKEKTLSLAVALLLSSVAWGQEGNVVRGEIKDVPHQGSYTPSFAADGTDKAVRNVILMIGDGTGLAQLSCGYFTNDFDLTIFNLRHSGFVTTASADSYTTDSAASATAYSTGEKTNNYMVGMSKDTTVLRNIPEMCAEKGIVSGIVSTDDLDGATPAGFFAHQPNRRMEHEIWADLPAGKAIFYGCGHYEKFQSQSTETQKAITDACTVVSELSDPRAKDAKKLAYLPPMTETQSMKEGRGDFLPATTAYAIDYLTARKTKNGKGFFLMVEGARIDKSAHSNDYPSMVKEVLDFDKAVEAAIRFAEKDGHTLVLVTADHETGGLSLGYHGDPGNGSTYGFFISGSHTPIPVPIFAYGPHSQDFTGVHGNDEVSRMIQNLLKLD